jgi:hypothetical protein
MTAERSRALPDHGRGDDKKLGVKQKWKIKAATFGELHEAQ